MTVEISIHTWHKKAETIALLDSGATHNFIDKRVVKSLGLGTRTLSQPRLVWNVNGTPNQAGTITQYCDLWAQQGKDTSRSRFFVTNLGRDRIILGHPWFKTFNPTIDWTTNSLQGESITLETASYQTKKRKLHNSPTARSSNINPSIPPYYHPHATVFDKEASQRFPLAREEDHIITLKPDAPSSLKCKVYPQTAAEEEATRTFINEHLAKGYIEESNSPYVSPFFFRKKKDGKLRPIMDYRVLNSWTVCDEYPLPLISTILDHLQVVLPRLGSNRLSQPS